jgi:hypothetical protein
MPSTTTEPDASRICPKTCGGLPPRNDAAMAVAPSAMSPPSLSKSNSAWPAIAGWLPERASAPPETMRAL